MHHSGILLEWSFDRLKVNCHENCAENTNFGIIRPEAWFQSLADTEISQTSPVSLGSYNRQKSFVTGPWSSCSPMGRHQPVSNRAANWVSSSPHEISSIKFSTFSLRFFSTFSWPKKEVGYYKITLSSGPGRRCTFVGAVSHHVVTQPRTNHAFFRDFYQLKSHSWWISWIIYESESANWHRLYRLDDTTVLT